MNRKVLFLFLMIFNISNIIAQFDTESQWATGQGLGTWGHWIGDFNGDGMDDKLNRQGSTGGDWWVSLSTGTSFSGETQWGTNIAGGATKYFVGDFNGDGMDDILAYFSTGGIWKLLLSIQSTIDGTYSFASPVTVATNKIIATANTWVGDFNGDGIDEILYYSSGLKVFLTYGNWTIQSGWGGAFTFTYSYVGDFNGDGYDDFMIYRTTDALYGNNCWLAALSVPGQNKFNFNPIVKWASGQGAGSTAHYFGDLDGDGKTDKLNFYNTGGQWFAALSQGTSFSAPEVGWCGGQGVNVAGIYVGDFNGDRLIDRASFKSNGEWWVGLNICNNKKLFDPLPAIYDPENNTGKIVATWYSPWYTTDIDLWFGSKRDLTKTPVVGWESTVSGIYSCQNSTIVDLQIEAMIKAGINLIIVDLTNGILFDDGTNFRFPEAHLGTNALFEKMKVRKESGDSWIPIALGVGYEFWGPKSFARTYASTNNRDFIWENWTKQKQRQVQGLSHLKSTYCNSNYSEIFFKYLGKPLLITWLYLGEDFPMIESGNTLPYLKSNDFTLVNAVNFTSTFANLNYSYNGSYVNGQDSKRFWGWGAMYPQPNNIECMSVMPGHFNYSGGATSTDMPRDGGDYYINSWANIMSVKPNISLICDWNNWNEETAIEGCVGINGWKDYHGNPQYDWYLQITQAYSYIFKNNSLPNFSIYIQDENYPNVYYSWNGSSATNRKYIDGEKDYPNSKPIIKLPHSWLASHGYNLAKTSAEDLEMLVAFKTSAYPNPFNPIVNIDYTLPETGLVEVKVYDILGREIESLVHEVKEKGSHKISWQASNYASGVYFYRVSWKDNVISKKIVLMK